MQNNPEWNSDLPVCSHVHIGGRQAGWHIPFVPFKLLRKAPHAHPQQHVVLNVNQTSTQGVQREGGDGVEGRRGAGACIPS